MSISISGSNLTTGLVNTVQSPSYGSLSFNGLNQSVVTSGTGSGAAGTALDIITGSPNWTVECWVYTSQYSKVSTPQYFLNQYNGQTVQFRISSGTDKSYVTYGTNFLSVTFYSSVLGYVYMESWPTTMTLNTWYHIALCKDTSNGERYYLYLNGVLISSTPALSGIAGQNGPWEFGFPSTYITSDPSYAFNGYLSNIRIVKGIALYVPPNVAEPSLPLTSTQSLNLSGYTQAITGTQTSLLLTTPNNASYLTDTSSYAQTVTGVNSPTSSALGPSTYSGSILFNGTDQYLTIARAAQFNYSTSDFTWEMWVYPTSSTWTTDTMYFIDHGPAVNQGSLHYTANKLVYYNYYNATNNPPYTANANYPSLYTIGGGSIPANTWTHIAVCRQNLVTNLFVNGKVVSSGPDPYNYATQSGSPFTNPIVSPASQSVFIGARVDTAYLFKGNISNVRIVNGVSVYNVGNFTPPVQPLPPIQTSNQIGSPSKAIFGSQTSLLLNSQYSSSFLNDSSYNNVTVTQQTTGAYPPSSYTMASNSTNPFNSNGSVFTPGSIYFNGTTQYLTVPANAVFAFGTGAFTVEAWVYLTTLQDILVFDTRTSAATTGIGFQINSSGVLCYIQAASTTLGTSALTTGTWYHIAWVYNGTTVTGYVNGVAGTPSTVSLSLTQNNASIGRSGVSSASFMAGYLSNLRVVTGAAVYTQNFTPTSGPFTTSQTFNQSGIPSCPVQSSQTELLLNTPANTSFLTDSSTNAFTVTNVGTATSNPFNPFSEDYTVTSSPGSIALSGTAQYLNTTTSSAFTLGTGDFTIEYWVYMTDTATTRRFCGNVTSITGDTGFSMDINTSGQIGMGGWTTFTYFTPSPSLSSIFLNKWAHVAWVRISGVETLYVNGTSIGSVTRSLDFSSNGGVYLGCAGSANTNFPLAGNMSNFRIVKGLGVYTGNFIPPSFILRTSQAANINGYPSAAVSSSQTSLLVNGIVFVDSSINNFALTTTGAATPSTSNPF